MSSINTYTEQKLGTLRSFWQIVEKEGGLIDREDGIRVATNICCQTNNARFCLVCCMLVMREKGTCKKKEKSVSKYHPPVSIQRRLNNESRITVQLAGHCCQKVIKRGLRPPRKWFVVCCLFVVAGGVAHLNPPPKSLMILNKITHRLRTSNQNPMKDYDVSNYIYGKVLLPAPRSQIAVSSICKLILFSFFI